MVLSKQNQLAREAEIEGFLRCFRSERGVYLSKYRAANGNFFSADLVKELFPCYASSKGGRNQFASLVHPYSHEEGEVGKFIFESLLEETSGTVTCVEGGSGVGKSCFAEKHRTTSLWVETTTCFPQLLKTLAVAGRPVKVIHLHGSPEDNIRSAMFRALIDGRRVPLKALIGTSDNSTHRLAQWLSGELKDNYTRGVDVSIEILNRDFSQNNWEFLPLSVDEFLKLARTLPEMVPNYKALHKEVQNQEDVDFPEVQVHYLQELEAYIF